ncbi:MAG TPA: serine--tRNA ligase [Atribacterota bacterium]|nr:serine--tRNA ligase [Atribacterota bacterium]
MLDLKLIRSESEKVKDAFKKRGQDTGSIDNILELDEKRRKIIFTASALKQERNMVSEEIARLKKEKINAQEKIDAMREVSNKIKEMDNETRAIDQQIEDILLELPNIVDESVPVGPDEKSNQVVKQWGKPKEFDFEPQPHWDLGEKLDILDFERGAKISAARFTVLKRWGAQLERALINFMLDIHTREHHYQEILPPFLVNAHTMMGTGQLPKFENDLFKTSDELYLIPTAEVPLTNLHQDEILIEADLPFYYTAYSACFRREAGSYGKDVRGLIRQHQFDKVELVKICKPEDSFEELEKLTLNAEVILERLELPYQRVVLSSGDMGFSAAKTYDLEVWLPFQGKYREISSCSNCTDFQARRANIRYREEESGKVQFVHTLNGSGIAVGRTMVAILENYQEQDGSIVIPDALRSYMNGLHKIPS